VCSPPGVGFRAPVVRVLPPAPTKSYHCEVADPERIEVERRPFRGDLLEALVVDVVGKEQRARPLGDRRRLVVGGVADAAAEAGGLVAS